MIDTTKIIHAPVGGGRYTVTAPIVKEDYGLYLKIEGLELPQTYEVDFSNSEHSGTSVTMIGNADGVLIPHQFIDTGKDVFAFLYHVGADFGRTVYKFRIPNKLRPDRTNEQPTPEQQSVIDQAISALNSAVAQTAEDVASADASAQSASESAEQAHDSAVDAQNYAESASGYASDAQGYATTASQKATAAGNSADQAAQIKTDIEGYVSTAQGYAQTASNKASQASQSATTASNKANEASGYANTASQKASDASGYATTASNKATEASGHASTASTKADEASNSASTALGYKTDAENAKIAAQTAQGKAEDAQEAAESAAASVSASATQIELNADAGTKKINDESFWTQGYWAVANGTITRGNTWNRSLKVIDDTVESIVSTNDIKLLLMAYDGSTYVGTWFGSGYSKTYDASYISHEINFAEFRKNYPTYTFRVTVTRTTSGELLPSETAQKVTIIKSIAKADRNGIQIMYGDLVNEKYWQNGGITAQGVDPTAYDSDYFKRVCTINKMRFLLPVTIIPKSGYTFSVNQYALDGTFEKQFSAWSSLPYTLSDANKLYRIAIKASNNSVLETSDISTYISVKLAESTPSNRGLAEYANVKSVNHRGYNTEAPENTLPAYLLSARYGYKYVETDVLFTSDGVPVLMHDDTIDRTCCHASDGSAVTGDISIESVSYADLIANYDACTSAQWATWAGVKVPTFEEFMRYCRALNLHPWVELKWTHTYTQAEVDLIISIVKKYGMEEHVSFISFSYDALALVKDAWDTVELGLNGSVSDAQLLKTGKNRVFMIYNYTSSYSAAINAGFQICFYTVNTENALNGINTYAYDSILTNTLLPSQVCDVVRNKSVT